MRYTARQQHCLQAMGMVPWVSRLPEDAAVLLKMASPASAEIHETATAAEQPAEPDRLESSSPPAAIESLGQWLLQQTLAPIEFRGGLHPVLGVADAPVLVVLAQDACSPAAGSMAGDDGRLFELMLRSIALSNRDTRRCQLDRQDGTAGRSEDVALLQAGVGGLCSAGTRGVLMLMNPWSFDVADTAVEQHQSRLPESGLPLWRIAHPSILLEQPQLKRQAWQVLKHLRATLDGTVL